MRKLLLHIGLPKTGTSTLQEQVFPNLSGYRYLGRRDGVIGMDLARFEAQTGQLIFCPDGQIEKAAAELDKAISSREDEFYEGSSNDPILVSSEIITSHLFLPADHFRFGLWALEAERLFSRLKAFKEHSKFDLELIVTQRNPKDFIHSYYAQQFYIFCNIPQLNTLRKYVEFGTDEKNGEFLSLLFNGKLETEIRSHFGEDQVRMWNFEDIFEDMPAFVAQEFTGSVLPAKTGDAVNVRRVGNNTRMGDVRPIWQKRSSLPGAVKKSLRTFQLSYSQRKKLQVAITWDDDLDICLQKYE
ncbi:MAG: hypothetical protein AAF456_00150 [Planctomycetota bacterium]